MANYMTNQQMLRLKYTLPNGQEQYQQVAVDRYAMEQNQGTLSMIQEQMQQRVNREIRQWVDTNATDYTPTQWYANSTATNDNWTWATDNSTSLTSDSINSLYRNAWQSEVTIKLRVGNRVLEIKKSVDGGEAEVTDEDIEKAKIDFLRKAKITILTKRAERKSEELLRGFISDIDFRNYKQRGYFTVKQGDKLYRIYRNKSEKVDHWERNERGVFVPKSRLCVHTQQLDLPAGDEALARLLLIRSGGIDRLANKWKADGLEEIKESELVLA